MITVVIMVMIVMMSSGYNSTNDGEHGVDSDD